MKTHPDELAQAPISPVHMDDRHYWLTELAYLLLSDERVSSARASGAEADDEKTDEHPEASERAARD